MLIRAVGECVLNRAAGFSTGAVLAQMLATASKNKVSSKFVCLAGNHSCKAARILLFKGKQRPKYINETELRHRRAYVFLASELTDDLIWILQSKHSFLPS